MFGKRFYLMNSLQYRLVHPPPLKVYQGVKFVKAANTRVWMIASINTIIHTSWWVCFLTSRSADVMYRSGFNVLVHIFHLHNHDVATADCMRHRDVSQETRERKRESWQCLERGRLLLLHMLRCKWSMSAAFLLLITPLFQLTDPVFQINRISTGNDQLLV